MFSGSRQYSEESLEEACEHQRMMRADLGGTEILAPLRYIYSKPVMGSHSRQVRVVRWLSNITASYNSEIYAASCDGRMTCSVKLTVGG